MYGLVCPLDSPYVDSCDEPNDSFEAEPYSFIADSAALLASFFAERASRFTLYSWRCLWMKAVGECDVRKVEIWVGLLCDGRGR